MVEHAGASCVLSLLIVAVFAVLLHEKQGTSKPLAVSTVAGRSVGEGKPPEGLSVLAPAPVPIPTPIPPAPVVETAAIRPTASVVEGHAPSAGPAAAVEPSRLAPVVSREPPRPREPERRAQLVRSRVIVAPASRKDAPAVATRKPQSSFVEVARGERLVDVAERVYGSAGAVEVLLRANRDQVAGRDDPVEAGTWLRTP